MHGDQDPDSGIPGAPTASKRADRVVDTLVIGGGVAGYSAAIAAAAHGRVLVVTKDSVRESNTGYAQGGVAAVLGEDDSFADHARDTRVAGADLCESPAVDVVVGEGPERIRELIEWGGAFDREGPALHLTREGGHSHHRVVHAHGDATGLEVQRTLVRRVRSEPSVEIEEFAFATDLMVEDGRCVGVRVLDQAGREHTICARSTILATGGASQIYRETTNPEIATGDGHAMAWRAGVEMADLEFVQFHPTTLYMAGSARQLVTEAVRGEGGWLVDSQGERFVFRYHPDGDLAPRDVVSRAIVQQLQLLQDSCVYLDLRHLGAGVRERFPGLNRACEVYGIDITRDLIPVHPSAHYCIGGCVTDLEGRTSLPGLYGAGEVTMSGLHGANRLASNSLLEGLVFGRRAGLHAAEHGVAPPAVVRGAELPASPDEELIHIGDLLNSVKSLMWKDVGLMRRGDALEAAVRRLEQWNAYASRIAFRSIGGRELQNMLTVAILVARGALWRRESRGTHYRLDHPEKDDAHFRVHGIHRQGEPIAARALA